MEKKEAQRIGKMLRERREERGLTQDELASKLNTSQGHIGDIENGRRSPSVDTVQRVMKALGGGTLIIKWE